MLAKDVKMKKIEPDLHLFYDGRKFRKQCVNLTLRLRSYLFFNTRIFTFSHFADAFIQSDLQMRTIEAIKTNKRETMCKRYDKSLLA